MGRRVVAVTDEAMDTLKTYRWPGNIRELQACVSNACLFCDGDTLAPEHFAHKPELFRQSEHRNEASDKPRAAEWLGLDLGAMSLASLEEKAIVASLERSKGNKVEAARRLGITRQTLYNKLKTLGIEVRRDIRKPLP